MINILLCGGSGTRLWPISRKGFPKQFCKLFGGTSLYQETLKRNSPVSGKTVIVASKDNYFNIIDQMEEINLKHDIAEKENLNIILEPVGRNTAPAISIACLHLDKDDIVLVTPSDHLITDTQSYVADIRFAEQEAEKGYLVTFGIKPSFPETGYGYIQVDSDSSEQGHAYDVVSFHEKPDIEKAVRYLASGNYFWNSGMFCFKAGVFLEELKKHAPDVYESSEKAYEDAKNDSGILCIDFKYMNEIRSVSIDNAVMEFSDKVRVVPASYGWNDIGSFDALKSEYPEDGCGNTAGRKYTTLNANNNFIISDKAVSILDVDDLVVIDTPDALLITKKGSTQKIRNMVEHIEAKSDEVKELKEITRNHITVVKPWGSYTVLEAYERFKIKRLVVKPGKRLSLQKHFHRSEHWVIVSGSAMVTKGDDDIFLKPNESIYIPAGEKHRVANPGIIDLILLEVQVGEYLSEEDIKRIEDDFDRAD